MDKIKFFVMLIIVLGLVGGLTFAMLGLATDFLAERENKDVNIIEEVLDRVIDTVKTTPEPTIKEEPEEEEEEEICEFTLISFYLEQNREAYFQFQAENPDFDIETIIWKVNASLHLPFYTDVRTSYEEIPLIINRYNRLPDDFMPHELVNITGTGFMVIPQAKDAFDLLAAAAREEGHILAVASAFRNPTRQQELYDRAIGNNPNQTSVAKPYHSEHQTGRAIDLGDGSGGLLDAGRQTPMGLWVAENAHRFGFIIRYREDTTHITSFIYEPWHITYVGEQISMYMYENNILSLEEFVGRNPNATFLDK